MVGDRSVGQLRFYVLCGVFGELHLYVQHYGAYLKTMRGSIRRVVVGRGIMVIDALIAWPPPVLWDFAGDGCLRPSRCQYFTHPVAVVRRCCKVLQEMQRRSENLSTVWGWVGPPEFESGTNRWSVKHLKSMVSATSGRSE
jgi:hypothetical protein